MSSSDERVIPDWRGNDIEDLAPGEERPEAGGLAQGVLGYVLGLVLASALTAASFYLAAGHLIWGPAIPAALITLAVAQMGIHLVFFLHITTGPDNTNNVLALAFGILIVGLLMGGSVWIIEHLNQHMPTMNEMMSRQR